MSYKSHIDQEAKEHEAVERWRKDLIAAQKIKESADKDKDNNKKKKEEKSS